MRVRRIALPMILSLGMLLGMSTSAFGGEQDVAESPDKAKRTLESDRREQILQQDPDLAGSISGDTYEVGMDSEAISPLTAFGEDVTSSQAAATTCRRTTAWVRSTTLLGFTAYKYNQHIYWCTDGVNVHTTGERYDFMSEVDPNFYYRERTADSVSAVPSSDVESFMQGRVENCVIKYGCIGNEYPSVKIIMRGNGTSSYEAWV